MIILLNKIVWNIFSIYWLNGIFHLGPVLVNDMQLPLYPFVHSSPLKSGQIRFKDMQWSETYERTVFRFFNFWEMVIFWAQNSAFSHLRIRSPTHSSPFRSGQIFIKDAECAETNEKRYKLFFFRFLFFELWVKIIENWPYLG